MNFRFRLNFHIFPGAIAVCMLLLCTTVRAQADTEETTASNDNNSVRLFADARLSVLTSFQETSKQTFTNSGTYKNANGSIHSAKGYRILIYSGIDRAKANSTKADFMRRHPGTRIYMTYALPQYRIKVGDYISRGEANEFYRQLSGIYSPCMVVPDIVEINTFRRND